MNEARISRPFSFFRRMKRISRLLAHRLCLSLVRPCTSPLKRPTAVCQFVYPRADPNVAIVFDIYTYAYEHTVLLKENYSFVCAFFFREVFFLLNDDDDVDNEDVHDSWYSRTSYTRFLRLLYK